MDVVVSGSHGLIGSALVPALEGEGHAVRRLVRGAATGRDVAWDPASGWVDRAALHGARAVVHLAGAGIGDRRWTPKQKRRIRDSRVAGTRALAEAVARLDPAPAVMVSGSAIGFYGDRGDEVLTEDSEGGRGFLADVCREWEEATRPAQEAGVRVVNVRTGVVLSGRGGALGRQLPLFRLGLGGRLGTGRQYTSWISLDDEVGGILHALDTPALAGPVNLTAPAPVTNAELTAALGRVLARPAVVPVPRLAMALVLGRELVDEVALASQRVLPARLDATAYDFRHRDVEGALRAVLGRPAAAGGGARRADR